MYKVLIVTEKKQVVIQKSIDEVMVKEFEKMLKEYGKDPLLQLILDGKITLPLEYIKNYILEYDKNERNSI